MSVVLLLCNDLIGERMAGPAIRYWELARHLADRYDVILAARERPAVRSARVAVVGWNEIALEKLVAEADVCFTQLVWPRIGRSARRHGTRIVLDCYDPILIEELESQGHRASRSQRVRNRRTLAKTSLSMSAADALVCANERQRDLWLGALMGSGRLTPEEYRRDKSLTKLVSLVPFGLPDDPPIRSGPSLREQLGLPADAVLLLWGGGVWNWFDPLTLLDAVDEVVKRGRNVHLAFLGLRHPNPNVPEAEMARRTLARAEDLGLLGTHVHANVGWTPYEARADALLDADIGVSTHFDHLETHYSFRTRVLDYLWAGLPIITTRGDGFADLVQAQGLGATVPPEDPAALAREIERFADDPWLRQQTRVRVHEAAQAFRWSVVADALSRAIDDALAGPAARGFSNLRLLQYLLVTAQEVMVEGRWQEARERLLVRGQRP